MSETLVLIGWIIAADNLKNVSPPFEVQGLPKKDAPEDLHFISWLPPNKT
jgi:hypothetical protein